jgi:hypothetical protein
MKIKNRIITIAILIGAGVGTIFGVGIDAGLGVAIGSALMRRKTMDD